MVLLPIWLLLLFSSVQSLSCVRLFVTPWITARQASLVHHQLPEFTQTHIHRVSDAIQLSHHLSFPSPPAPNPSQHQGLSQWVNSPMRWPNYWSFSFSISPLNEHQGLISFRIDWVGSPCSPRDSQESSPTHSSKASILWCSAFFTVQLSHPYITTGKTITLTAYTHCYI